MLGLEYFPTSQGLDVFLFKQRIGAIINCPLLGCAIYRSLSGTELFYKDVSWAILAIEHATMRAKLDGRLSAFEQRS